MGERSGMLNINSGRKSAVIYFKRGQAVHAQVDNFLGEAAVFEIFNWEEGKFAFQTDVGAPERTITMDCQNLIMEAVRRLDEWDKIRGLIPSDDYVAAFSAAHEELASRVTLEATEWKVISQVDGVSSVKDIAERAGIGEFETALVIYNLAKSGLLEVGPSEPAVPKTETLAETISEGIAVSGGNEVSSLARLINALLDNFDYPDGLYNAIEQDITLVERISLMAERYPEMELVPVDGNSRIIVSELEGRVLDIDELSRRNLLIALAEVKEQIYQTAEKQSNAAAAARRHDKVFDAVFGGGSPANVGLGGVLELKSRKYNL
jgi:hypothetical protein